MNPSQATAGLSRSPLPAGIDELWDRRAELGPDDATARGGIDRWCATPAMVAAMAACSGSSATEAAPRPAWQPLPIRSGLFCLNRK